MKSNSTTDRVFIISIAVILVTAIVVIAVSLFQSRRVTESAAMVTHTQEVLFCSQELLSLVIENESSARGYALTGQNIFSEPLKKSQTDIHGKVSVLKRLTADNPAQQIRIDSLSVFIKKRIDFSDSILAVRNSGGAEAAVYAIGTGQGKFYTDRIKTSVRQIIENENILLEQRRKSNEKKIIQHNSVLLFLMICILVLLIIFVQKARSDNLRKKESALALEKMNNDLEMKVAQRTAELQRSNTTLEETFLRITDAFLSLDKNWCYVYVNKQLGELVHRDPASLIGKNVWEEFPAAIGSATYDLFHKAMKEQYYMWNEDYYAELDIWQENHVYPSPEGLSVYIRDISERKRKERDLDKLNRDLEAHVKELAVSNKELEHFAYVASHDLQEPLRMITSFLSQLEKKYNNILDDKGKKYIYYAVDGAMRMRQIILDLLEFSRIGKAEEKLEDVNLNIVLHDVLMLHNIQIEETKAVISADDLPVLHIAKSPMRQVFHNLIGNSLKYRKAGITPRIKISVKESPTHWEFSIADNGIGINPVYFNKIFIIFQRLHNREEFSGTGMGLAITKKIIESTGGTIRIESEEQKGSTFYFTVLKTKEIQL